jgi:hypothetical protein
VWLTCRAGDDMAGHEVQGRDLDRRRLAFGAARLG